MSSGKGSGGKKRKKRGEEERGVTGGVKGAKAGAPPPFTAREVSRDRGNFLLSRAILASKTAAEKRPRRRPKTSPGSASFRKRDRAPEQEDRRPLPADRTVH